MNILISKLALASAALVIGGAATAGDWEVWTEKRSETEMVLMTSFAGDGQTEEAHLDLSLAGPFEIVKIDTLQKGAICVGSSERNMLRAVPPSGAGTPLSQEATDACMFTLRVKSQGKGRANAAGLVKISRSECSSSYAGDVPCAAKIQSLK
jgi:hypothetical protein